MKSTSILAGLVFASCLVSCSREYLTVAETDVVVTRPAQDSDFSQYKTYVAPDEVIDLCDVEGPDGGVGGAGGAPGLPIDPERCKEADHSLDDEILEALRANMDALGYREVDGGTETPDVALLVGIVAQDNWYAGYSPGYCYPSYYYYGCWYPGYTYAYNLATSSIIVEMADVSESSNGSLASVWTAFMQGLHQSSSEKSGAQRVKDAMGQAFRQSSYLADGGEK